MMDKKAILKQLQSEFEAAKVSCEWIDAGEESPVDLLVTTHERIGLYGVRADGEFFFLDYDKAAEHTEYLMCMLTLQDELQTGYATELLEGIMRLNFYLPYGAFALGSDGEVVLKLAAPLSDEIPQEAASVQAGTMAAHTLDLFHRYIGLIIDLAEGKLKPSEIVELFEGSAD